MESWLSGRKRLTANEVSCQRDRGFESHTLRQENKVSESTRVPIWSTCLQNVNI